MRSDSETFINAPARLDLILPELSIPRFRCSKPISRLFYFAAILPKGPGEYLSSAGTKEISGVLACPETRSCLNAKS